MPFRCNFHVEFLLIASTHSHVVSLLRYGFTLITKIHTHTLDAFFSVVVVAVLFTYKNHLFVHTITRWVWMHTQLANDNGWNHRRRRNSKIVAMWKNENKKQVTHHMNAGELLFMTKTIFFVTFVETMVPIIPMNGICRTIHSPYTQRRFMWTKMRNGNNVFAF